MAHRRSHTCTIRPTAARAQELRAPLFALRAFNVETALIGEHAKGEMLVLMRCQVGGGAGQRSRGSARWPASV